jgi:hypothetical protein
MVKGWRVAARVGGCGSEGGLEGRAGSMLGCVCVRYRMCSAGGRKRRKTEEGRRKTEDGVECTTSDRGVGLDQATWGRMVIFESGGTGPGLVRFSVWGTGASVPAASATVHRYIHTVLLLTALPTYLPRYIVF